HLLSSRLLSPSFKHKIYREVKPRKINKSSTTLSFLELGFVQHSVRHKRVSQFSATFARRQKRQCYVALIICVVWTHLRSENFEFSLSAPRQHPARKVEAPGVMSTY
uniref:Uncharacterized protein n=2 Tax=Brassica oleracea TaxID=3712 RepID=A0A0D3E9W4_BRAOL